MRYTYLYRMGIFGCTSLALVQAVPNHQQQVAFAAPALAVPVTTSSAFLPLEERNAQLKLVQVVFRHGARTPLTKRDELWRRLNTQWDVCKTALDSVPLRLTTPEGEPAPVNNHNKKQSETTLPGGCHSGQLTEAGQKQANALGEWLRKRYVDDLKLLPSDYQEGIIQARTTNFQRTIATLAGVLTGLLGNQVGPVPAVTSSELSEILYADTKQCPHLKFYLKMGKDTSSRLVRSDPEYEWTCEQLKRMDLFDGNIENPKQFIFADLNDVVTSLRSAGKHVPSEFTPRLIKALDRLATKEFAPLVAPSVNDAHGKAVLRLSMGVLLHTLVERMQAAVQEQPSQTGPRMYLYSGHDSTIWPILSALGAETLEYWPPYLSNLVFELWQLPVDQGGHHVVRVLFNKEELDIPHCPSAKYATLDTFKQELIAPFLISAQAISEACKVPMEHDTAVPHVADDSDISLSSASSAGDEDDHSSTLVPTTPKSAENSKL